MSSTAAGREGGVGAGAGAGTGTLGSLGDALAGLTLRGRSFLTAGAACVVAAVLFGQRDLLRVGILLFAVPLACVWVVARTRYRLACVRRLQPARVAAGQEARVALELDNVSRLPTGLLLVEDQVPYLLGTRPRFVLDRVEPRGRRVVAYPVRSLLRGRFALGPLSIRLTDPFGMCELQRSFTARDTLTVTPQVVPLPAVPLGGERTGSGESRGRSLAAAGEDDAAPREYRHGDPLHRVHWRSTARHGELMVRREEQPWQSRATVLLDTRAGAHRGDGAASSFEWAVVAAASIGVALGRQGYQVRLIADASGSVGSVGSADAAGFAGWGLDGPSEGIGSFGADGIGGDEGMLLDALSVVTPAQGDLRAVRGALRGAGAEGVLVAVLGAVDVEQAAELARLRSGRMPAVGLLLDVSVWTALPAGARSAAQAQLERSAALLRQAGWRVVRVRPDDDLATLWATVSGAAPSAPVARAS